MMETMRESGVVLKFGVVEEVDEQGVMVRVYLPDWDFLTHWLPVNQAATLENQDYRLFDEGTQVSLLLDSRGEEGVVLGAIYSEADPPPVTSRDKWHRRFKDGTTLEYDRAEHKLAAVVEGEVDIKARGAVKVKTLGTADVNALAATVVATTLLTIKSNAVVIDTPACVVTGAFTALFTPPPPLLPEIQL